MAIVASAEAGLAAAARGATALQLRMPGAPTARLELEARRLARASAVPLLVSDRVDVALAAGVAGVNLPEAGLPVAAARRLMPVGLVGRSVHSPEAARAAEREGADFVIFGPVFETPSHPAAPGRGLEALGEVCRAVAIPVLAIGGIDRDRAAACRAAGAAGFAAIGYWSP